MDKSDKAMKSRAWYPILTVGVSMVGFISIKTGRDAVFFSSGGIKQLPLAYIFIAIASVPAALLPECQKAWVRQFYIFGLKV